jgi:tryptophan synthase alpha chain
VRPGDCWALIRAIRAEHPALPIGLLVYANLVEARGLQSFYAAAAAAGADSVLVADAPTLEAGPYVEAARGHGLHPVLVAAPNTGPQHLSQIARLSGGYTYVVTRSGVTGADDHAQTEHLRLLQDLRRLGAAPCLLGFGISRPEHVRSALAAGAAGAISGSAVVRILEEALAGRGPLLPALDAFVRSMKAATRPAGSHPWAAPRAV